MERPKLKLTLLLYFVVSAAFGQGAYRSEIYSAYIGNRMDDWKNAIDRMESNGRLTEREKLELVNYQYGYIGWCVGNDRPEEAKKYLKKAEAVLEELSADNRNMSVVLAYRSAFYGYKIGLNKVAAPFLGPKSADSAEKSVKLDPRNYLAYVQLGNIQFYMPAVFGGSKKEALSHFLKAESLLSESASGTAGNWNYLSLLVLIAQSYSYTGDLVSSKKYLEKILSIEPGFLWVKNELYPQITNKIKEKQE